jgi:hypothetical protein
MLSARRVLQILPASVALSFVLLTPSASADPIEDAGETVGDTISEVTAGVTDPVTGAVDGAPDVATGTADSVIETVTETVTGPVDSVTDIIEDTTQDATGPIEDVVDTVTDTVDDAVDTVTDTVDDAVDTVEDTTEEVTETVEDATETAGEPVGPQPEGSEPSETRDPGVQAPGAPEGEGGISSPGNPPSGSGAPHDGGVTRPNGQLPLQTKNGTATGGRLADQIATKASTARRARNAPVFRPTSAGEPATDGRRSAGADSIIRRALEAAKHPAFPLLLALVVMGYIALQNRVDRKDPKLAAATVDSEQDLLPFE